VSLDRQSIEKRDFPIGRRGYEPEAVDAHLRALATEVERLQQQLRERPATAAAPAQSGASLASSASDQVRLIVQAAESSAAEIEQQARDEAARIRDEATGDAETTRHEAIERSRSHVGRVDDATHLMLQRVEAMESELGALTESLRTGANRLNADLSLLQGNMDELYDAAGGERGAPPRAAAPAAPRPAPAAPAPVVAQEVVEIEEIVVAVPAEEPAAADDGEGARLVALDMALSGTSREETGRYLAVHYVLAVREALLDEVYASI
jgi:cell division septum initiation protein DivIVA